MDTDDTVLWNADLSEVSPTILRLQWESATFTTSLAMTASASMACDADDHFMGFGSAMDMDHIGQAFPLWVSEPGIERLKTKNHRWLRFGGRVMRAATPSHGRLTPAW